MHFLINWFEIPTHDITRAVAFYNEVFGFSLEVMESGEEKMACFPTINGISGALSQAPGFTPSATGTQVTFDGGSDLEQTLARVRAAGGTVVREKTKIEAEGRGSFALIADSEGNTVGLYSAG